MSFQTIPRTLVAQLAMASN